MLLSIGTQTFVALPPRELALMAAFGPFENPRPAGRALLTALKVEWQNYHKPFSDMQLATASFLSQSPQTTTAPIQFSLGPFTNFIR